MVANPTPIGLYDFLVGGGAMGALIRSKDWADTPLGPIEEWPRSLKTVVFLMLNSRYPMFVWWGRELINFYNDAYIPVLGGRHPTALGQPAGQIWGEIWDVIGPQAEIVMREGRATWNDSILLVMERYGYTEETYFTFSYSPAIDDDGHVGGVFCACTEDTKRVLGERRLRTLRALAEQATRATSVEEALVIAAATMRDNPLRPALCDALLAECRLRRGAAGGRDDGGPSGQPRGDRAQKHGEGNVAARSGDRIRQKPDYRRPRSEIRKTRGAAWRGVAGAGEPGGCVAFGEFRCRPRRTVF